MSTCGLRTLHFNIRLLRDWLDPLRAREVPLTQSMPENILRYAEIASIHVHVHDHPHTGIKSSGHVLS